MSVFQVNLKTLYQGTMDIWSTGGRTDTPNTSTGAGTGTNAGAGTSLQRQVYVMGPKRINRLMKDGTQFTDCNYWKQFCPFNSVTNPFGCDPHASFLSLISDDGSIWSSVPSEETFAWSTPAGSPVAGVVSPGFASVVNFATLFGSYAVSAIITNTGSTTAIVRINGGPTFSLAGGATQVFSTGDIVITTIEVQGAPATAAVSVFAGVKQVSNS